MSSGGDGLASTFISLVVAMKRTRANAYLGLGAPCAATLRPFSYHGSEPFFSGVMIDFVFAGFGTF
jgi:hypothetical protein